MGGKEILLMIDEALTPDQGFCFWTKFALLGET